MIAAVDTTTTVPVDSPVERGGIRGTRLLAIAWRNLRRRVEYTVLATVGIALTVTVGIVVQAVSTGYQSRGAAAYDDAVGAAPVWMVPPGGVTYDPALGVLLPKGPLPNVPRLGAGWRVQQTIGARATVRGRRVAVFGHSTTPVGVAMLSPAAMHLLRVGRGATLSIAGTTLRVRPAAGHGLSIAVPLAVARAAGATKGWLTITPPPSADVRSALARTTHDLVTADPAQAPPAGEGTVYLTRGGGGVLTFRDRFAAVLGGRVQGSVLGIVAKLALVLGFVISVTSFVSSVQERRREFGIMASVGLSDEVLYFFLTEALVVFAAAYAIGASLACVLLAALSPGELSVGDVAQAAALVLSYLPALGIVAALVPAHRIVQQRPVDLLSESA